MTNPEQPPIEEALDEIIPNWRDQAKKMAEEGHSDLEIVTVFTICSKFPQLPSKEGKLMTDLTALWREDATEEEQIEVYQDLINSGQAWRMEGHVGRTAMALIENGICTLGEEAHTDYWGNRVPSRHEVQPGTPGSAEFVEQRSLTDQ